MIAPGGRLDFDTAPNTSHGVVRRPTDRKSLVEENPLDREMPYKGRSLSEEHALEREIPGRGKSLRRQNPRGRSLLDVGKIQRGV